MRQSVTTERENAACSAAIRAPAFVGREREVAVLTQALVGGPAVVVVEGEAGIGKTRLIKEFVASPAVQRLLPLVATCPPFRQPHTLGPVVDAVRQAAPAGVGELTLSALAGALRPLFPDWVAGLPAALDPAEDPTAARHRVFTALGELLAALDIRMLVVEDLHWADEATLEFLLYLASRQPQQVSLLVTCRPEEVPEGSLLRRLSRHAAGSTGLRVTLPALSVGQTASLVSSMLAGEKITDEFAAFLHERTEGLPLAVEESVRLMGDRADLAFRHGAWARRHLADIEVPPTVRDAVLERGARLGPGALAVLRAAAVLAEPAAAPLLMAVADLTETAGQAGLGEALGCGLVIENRSPTAWSVVFRHALAARAVYDAIPATLRRGMHQRAGQALQDVTPVPLARQAYHFRESGDSVRWSQCAEQAADTALAAGDHHTAAALLHDLVVHAGLPPGEVVRLACRVPMRALPECSSIAAIAQSLRTAVGSGGLSVGQQAEAGWRLSQILIDTGDYAAAATELEQAIPGLAHRPAEAAAAMIGLGWPLHGAWPTAEHRRWLDRAAAALSDPLVPASDRRTILGNHTTALLLMGEKEGWKAVAALPQDTAVPREALSLTIDWMNAGEVAMYWGKYPQARRALTVALRLATQHQYSRMRQNILVLLAHLDWFTGTWDGLAKRAKTLLADLTDDEPLACTEAALTLGLLDAAVGATGRADQRLRLVLEERTRRGTAIHVQEPAAALARLRLADGQLDEVLVLTEDPVRVTAAKGIWLWATEVVPVRVQALATMGRTTDAEVLVNAFAKGLRDRELPAPAAALAFCRAVLAESINDRRHAAAAFGRAADAWRALPRPYDALLAQEQQARCLTGAGQHDAALALLAETHQGLAALGASADADRIAHALRVQGRAVPRVWRGGRRGYGNQLSPREREVVRLVAAGHTNREIAQALFRSPRTVAGQLNSAMRKLGVSTRTALAVAAVNLVSEDQPRPNEQAVEPATVRPSS